MSGMEPTEAGGDTLAGGGGRSAAPVGCLLLVADPVRGGSIVELARDRPVLLGRDPTADIVVDEAKVSRQHARLRWRGDDVTVEDLGSRNGTKVNETVITSASVRVVEGDRIQVGRTRLVVSFVRPTASAGPDASHEGEPAVVADPQMRHVLELSRRLGPTPTSVLILGETGVGKDVIARAIHAHDPRGGPFVRLNCAATPAALLERELFGHEKGAFTGADRRAVGFVEAAHGGTLFLDEIGELSADLQAKLLHVLENRTITRVGSPVEIPVDIRVLAATHRDLEAATERGEFRRDLYYRLAVFRLEIPPLRERPTEIPLLAAHFLDVLAAEARRTAPRLSPDAVAALVAHAWPGNVRELRNAMAHALVLAGAEVTREHLPPAITAAPAGAPAPTSGTLPGQLDAIEQQSIVAALQAEGGNRTRAAKRLGISRRALQYKLGKYGID